MGLRDMLRAIREYPAALAELRRTQQALERNEQTCAALRDEAGERANHERFLTRQLAAVQTALVEFCPRLSSLEDMKRFYNTISPSVDPQGFTLYHMAEKLTGIDVSSFFLYEDNRGLFAEADGRQLLRWLTAADFHAVDWSIVPGTTYERAALREVDTAAPEYREFERQLYEKTLERMGFQDILAPKQEMGAAKEQVTELRLYSPLSAELVEEAPVRDWIEEPEPSPPQPLTGDELSAPEFRAAILRGIEDEQSPEEAERGLMAYFYGSDAVDEKVVSIVPSVEETDGRLYGVAVCQVKGKLAPEELAELKEYCTSQYADGWGEGYEQRPRKTSYGELYVSFWQSKDFFILTKEELETKRTPSRAPRQPNRGGVAR